ncbi:MAG: hypothetical protein LH615_07635, partial [Ferruginibacter sp.]|nr:hypothetical protein [Ferruginibacter sp.]
SAQNFVANKKKGEDLYAGIDVGSKGVKLSVIQMGKNASLTGSFVAVKDTAVNTDFISFTPASFSATVKGMISLYNVALNEYKIPAAKIFTVISSGIKGQAEKENKMENVKALADSFKIYINDPKRNVPVIDAMGEARLSHLGIVPEARRYNTFLIDIGSGNTKGGYFKNGDTKELKLFMLNWGTKTVANATEKRMDEDKTLPNYKKLLNRVLAGDPDREIVYAVNESGAYNMNDNFAFSGGIAWAVATMLYPELSENSVVPLNFEDLHKFNEKLTNNYASMTPEIISKSVTDKILNKAEIALEISRVQKVFDQRALMAGTSLLLNIVRQFEGTQEKKHFFLVKNGQVGWISAYVSQSVNKMY